MSSKKFYEQSLVLPILLPMVAFPISLISPSSLGDLYKLWWPIELISFSILATSMAIAIPYMLTAIPLGFWMKVGSRTNQELRRALLISPLLFASWMTMFLRLWGTSFSMWSIKAYIVLLPVFLFAGACAFLWIGPVLWYGRRLEVREANSVN